MRDRRLRIFIGIPAYGEIPPEVYDDHLRFMFHLGRRMPEVDFFIGVRTKAEQFRARNQIVEAAAQVDADYLLMIDDDMIINVDVTSGVSETYDLVKKLLAHNVDIVGALYYQKVGECAPVAMMKADGHGYRFLRDDELTRGLQRVDVAGGGCLLVKMNVFNHLVYPYFAPEFEYGTDIQLCRKAAEKGFTVWLDSSIELGHLKPTRSIVSGRTRHAHQIESVPGEVKRTYVGAEVYDDLLKDACAFTGYPDIEAVVHHATAFLKEHDAFKSARGAIYTDHDWYRQFPNERVARQVWFNSLNTGKREMTQFILNSVNHAVEKDILDFGCGIGIPAFVFAQKGHRVTAADLDGTGTFAFLQWRAKTHQVPITFHSSRSDVPALGGAQFDVIVAMDCLEHIAGWRRTLAELAAHLKPEGVLFANNAILDDTTHPEHYALKGKDFVEACLALDLIPVNEITYQKRVREVLETPRRVSLVGSA